MLFVFFRQVNLLNGSRGLTLCVQQGCRDMLNIFQAGIFADWFFPGPDTLKPLYLAGLCEAVT